MGPLKGIRIVEFAGIGPGPFAAMMLADMGAEIVRLDRKGAVPDRDLSKQVLHRGRRSIALDLKKPEAVAAALRLIEGADALIEGFRPGVMERLGLGPDVCLARNPRLVYGRMTGWGQDGPLAKAAGHDINYIALCGALWSMGEADRNPMPPLNLVGDFGGGGMVLALGILAALLEAKGSGRGQVVDAAMTDGSAALMGIIFGYQAMGRWFNRRGYNHLDGGAPYYNTYKCADGKWICIASIEPQFYAELLRLTGLTEADLGDRENRDDWPRQRQVFADLFATKTRDAWCAVMEGSEVCFAPVLDLEEAPHHAHNRARNIFVEVDGLQQPAPAPRFSRTESGIQGPPPLPGQHNDAALADWGFSGDEIAALKAAGAV
ncbi:MAG: CoA transferase [Hyphomicrobiales bacterium]|nr:CoA transferase [Hyphomicrobiales bacterium]